MIARMRESQWWKERLKRDPIVQAVEMQACFDEPATAEQARYLLMLVRDLTDEVAAKEDHIDYIDSSLVGLENRNADLTEELKRLERELLGED